MNYNVRVLSMDGGGEPTDYLASRFNLGVARFSPDGRWVAYVSNVSGTAEVTSRHSPIPQPNRRW